MQDFLKALGVAATNPLAFVAYLAAVICWLLLRWRVDRNKNLLNRLNSVPPVHRAALLRDEMGIDPMRGGFSPEQRIQSRIHRYYFLSFVVASGVGAVIFAIANFNKPVKAPPPDPNFVQKVQVQNDPDAAEDHSAMRKLAKVELGSTRAFVEEKLGLPDKQGKERGSTCASYVLPSAKVKVLYTPKNTVWVLFVVITDPNYRYPLMGKWGFDDTAGEIGNFSFNALRDNTIKQKHNWFEPKNPPFQQEPIIMTAGLGGSGGSPDGYAEKYPNIVPSEPEDLYLVWTSDGYKALSEETMSYFGSFMHDLEMSDDENKYIGNLSTSDLIKVNMMLDNVKPNAFAYISRPYYDALTGDQILNATMTIDDGGSCVDYGPKG